MTFTQFIIPTIEEALFGEFSKKRISSFIFNKSIEYSRNKFVNEWFNHKDFNLKIISDVCKSKFIEIDDYLNSKEDKSLIARLCRRYPKREYNMSLNPDGGVDDVNPPVWSSFIENIDFKKYSYWATVWIRINCTMCLLENFENIKHEKGLMFINAHILLARYLDSLDDPSDEHINISVLCNLYKPLGKSRFDVDRNLIKVESNVIQVRKYPLEIIKKKYPNMDWHLETVRANIKLIQDHGYLLDQKWFNDPVIISCLAIMVQCKILHKTEEDMEVRDALWFYHHCFLDYIYNYPKTDNLYPFDNRCFTGYDLPNVFHVLVQIPFWDKENSPDFPLGKFIQKSLPFAGARRTLINQTDNNIETDVAFWKLFSSVFYCLLLDTYPEHISKNRDRCFDLKKLLDIIKLTGDKELLRESLARNSFKASTANFNKENDKGCYIVFTAFRMWVIMNIYNQKHYREGYIDFNLFENQVVEMAKKIRESDFTSKDIFSEAREYLSKNNKSSKSVIYRYRKHNVINTILDQMMNSLEKELFKELESWNTKIKIYEKSPIKFAEELLKAKEIVEEIPSTIKTNILNSVIRMKKNEWITPLSLSIMRDERYGGVSEFTIMIILKLIDIYYNSAKPKDFESCIGLFECKDFKVVSWYFHVVKIVDKIDFDPLTLDTIENIDYALMTSKFLLYPGQMLPLSVFDVFFTICCGKIKTLTGLNEYGHEGIAYDINENNYQCAKIHKKITSENIDDETVFSSFEKQKKDARKQRKDFNFLPCKNNPLLSVSIRGFMLIYDKKRFMHCPSCGSFHQFKWTGFKGDCYKCTVCRSKEEIVTTCHVCYEQTNGSRVVVDPLASNGIFDVFQHLYFCKKH